MRSFRRSIFTFQPGLSLINRKSIPSGTFSATSVVGESALGRHDDRVELEVGGAGGEREDDRVRRGRRGKSPGGHHNRRREEREPHVSCSPRRRKMRAWRCPTPPLHLTSSGFPSAVFFEYHWSIGKHIRCGVAGFCIRNDHSP